MITFILTALFFLSILLSLGKVGKPFMANPLTNILSLSPVVLLFIDTHYAINLITLSTIGFLYGISNDYQLFNKTFFIWSYFVVVIIFLLNNMSVFV
jgi:hypothetical protein